MTLVGIGECLQNLGVHAGIVVAGEASPVGIVQSHVTILTALEGLDPSSGNSRCCLDGGAEFLAECFVEHG